MGTKSLVSVWLCCFQDIVLDITGIRAERPCTSFGRGTPSRAFRFGLERADTSRQWRAKPVNRTRRAALKSA